MKTGERSQASRRLPRIARLQWLDAQISAGRYPNAPHMARELGISERTAWDDHAYFCGEMNAPVRYSSERKGWYYTDKTFALPLIYVSDEQAAAVRRSLLAATEFLGEADAAPLQTLFDRLEARAGSAMTSVVGKDIVTVGGAVHLAPSATTSPEHLQECCRAVCERRKLHLRYHGAHRDEGTERIVRPYHLHNERGEWYLLAHCELRDALRTFLLGRIEQQTVASDSAAFRVPADFDAPALLRQGFHLQYGADPIEVVIQFDAYQARWIRERVYHPTQTMAAQPDGGLLLTLRVTGTDETKRWVLQFGSHAQVLSPATLRADILAEITRMQKNYENISADTTTAFISQSHPLS